MNFFLCRWVRRALVFSAVVLPGVGAAPLQAEGLKSAQVSRLYNDVKLLPENQQARAAAVADVVTGKAAVQTGTGSRAELVFTDKTLTRLGANTFFSFENGTRNLDLGKGTMLLQVPKAAGGAEIHTAAVTAAITGTTLMVEYNPKSYSKIIVLEGTVRAYLKGHVGESILIHAGEMLITPPDAKRLPDAAVSVDLSVLYATSGLLDDRRFGPLPSDRLVSNEINHQKGDVAKGKLHSSNLFIAGLGTQVQVGNLAYVGATNTRITAQQGHDTVINLEHPGSGNPPTRTPPPASPTVPPTSPTAPPTSPTVPPVSPTAPPVSPTVPPTSPTAPPTSPTVPPVSPTAPPVSPTVPPTSPTAPPTSPTVPPVSPTAPPVSPTAPPVSPTAPPTSPTAPPVSPTAPPVSPTAPPVSPTAPPISPTAPPVSPTAPPVSPTAPPVSPTAPPTSPTAPPVSPTAPPVSPTAPPTSPTAPPVSPTAPPVSPTAPPVSPTAPPVSPTPPPVSPTPPPVSPTAPPVSPTPPPVSPTPPPVSPTPPPVSPTAPPVSPTPPPVSPTPPPVSPTPTPGKTGPLVAIAGNDASSPSLYNIDNTTAVLTDPYITTQGITSYGKIYRGSAAGDGAPSSFLLGASTPSSFDNQIGFDTQFDTGTQIGAFLFGSLAFTASPASISNTGGPTSLALVATNGISASPKSTVTVNVNGLTQVLLATQNGPINLTGITFTDNSGSGPSGTALTLYARGTGNSLTLNTAVELDVHGSLSLYGEGGLNFNAGAAAPSITTATLFSGGSLTVGGTIQGQGTNTAASTVTATSSLTISSGGISTVGPLTLTDGGAFQSDGFTTSSQNTLTITSTGDLTTTSNAMVSGKTVVLNTGGVLTLGGETLYGTSLNATGTGGLNVPGIVGGGFQSGTPQPVGMATFGTSIGSVSVSGQITASVVTFNVTAGDYSTASTAAITADTVNINAPNGNVSLSAGAYLPTSPEANSIVTVFGNNITVPDMTFTPQANQVYELTQPGAFTVPANASYAFDQLTLNSPDTAAYPGSLVLGANSTLNLATASLADSLSLADGSTFTVGNATIAQTVTLTGTPTLNISGVFEVKNTDGATDAFTATGAATINLSNPFTSNYYGLNLDTGNFNGGSATINGLANSSVSVENGDFTTSGAVTVGGFFISGNVSVGGALRAASATLGSFGDSTATVGALSVQNLSNTTSVIVSGDVTPYDRTQLDSLSPGLLEVNGNLTYAGLTTGTVPTDLNGGQLKITVQSPFNIGPGVTSECGQAISYATGADFSGAVLSPNADNLTAGNGGSLTITTGISSAGSDFRVGDFTDGNLSTTISLQGGNLTSAGGNTGLGGNGGFFEVDSAGNIYVNNNVTISAYGGDFDNTATVTGLGAPTGGNGGTVTLNANNGAILFTDSTIIDLHGGAVGSGGASGGGAGRGGTLTLNAAGAITLGDNSGTAPLFNAQGGVNYQSGASGNGGTVMLTSTGGSITMEAGLQVTADGGLLQGASGFAGNGGSVTLQASGVITIGNASPETFIRHVRLPQGSPGTSGYVFLTADGGTADQPGLVGGNGGTINITSANPDTTQTSILIGTSLISATTGGNSMTNFGGIGGTINITATDTTAPSPEGSPPPVQIDIANANLIASDDGTETANTPDSHSQVGGTINITSMRPSGPGILVENGSALTALVNAASTGAGGTIKLLTSGATIEVDSSTLQASGTGSLVDLDTQTPPPASSGGTSINLTGSNLSADTISLLTAGPNDTVSLDGGNNLTAISTLTITANNISLGGVFSTDQLAASMTTGTINLNATNGTAGGITLDGGGLSANSVNLTATGDNSFISIGNAATITAGSNLTINGASIEVYGNGEGNENGQLTASNTGGTISLTAATTTTAGMISLSVVPVMADQITLNASGPGSSISFDDEPSGNVVAQSLMVLSAPIINLYSSTLSADSAVGTLTLDTTDATQTGQITVNGTTLSAATVNLTARGTGGTVTVTDGSSLTGNTSLALSGAIINLTGTSTYGYATLTAGASTGTLTLDTVDPLQNGAITVNTATLSAGTLSLTAQGTTGTITVAGTSSSQQATLTASNGNLTLQAPGASGSVAINPYSALTASSVLEVLAPGSAGVITVGNTSNNAMSSPAPTMLMADTLKMRALGTTGSIVINANSTLSATNQLLLYADGSNGSITFQGGNITLNTGSLHGILAAPSITINTNTTVTVNGSQPIQVYTDHPNYSDDFGGNDNQSGGFAGTAQPSAAPLPFSSAPPYPTPTPASANAIKVAANGAAASPAPGLTPTPAPVATRGNRAKPAGTTPRVTLVSARRPSIPFSALNPKDLSYDPGLLQGGSPAPAAAVRHGKARAGAPATGVADAARDKARAATGRAGTGSNRPAAPVLPNTLRLPR